MWKYSIYVKENHGIYTDSDGSFRNFVDYRGTRFTAPLRAESASRNMIQLVTSTPDQGRTYIDSWVGRHEYVTMFLIALPVSILICVVVYAMIIILN